MDRSIQSERKRGRPVVYSDNTVANLLMIMTLNQIRTFKGLHRYLQQNPDALTSCGLSKAPSRRTLSRRLQRLMPLWETKNGRPKNEPRITEHCQN